LINLIIFNYVIVNTQFYSDKNKKIIKIFFIFNNILDLGIRKIIIIIIINVNKN